jgi:hypothetical protein
MNRARVRINWNFNRRAARRKFHYKKEILYAVKDLVVRLGNKITRRDGTEQRCWFSFALALGFQIVRTN